MQRFRRGSSFAFLILLVTGGGQLGCRGGATSSAEATPAAPVAVEIVQPHRGEIARVVTLPAFRIQPLREAIVFAKVAGYLEALHVDKGDVVAEGQLLGEIEVPELLADEAQFAAEAEVARVNYERMARAQQKAADLVVPKTVDDLRGQWEVARAKLQRTRTLLQYARLTAPFDGIVTARWVDPGAFIPAATSGNPAQSAAVVTLMDFTRVRVQVFVPEVEARHVRDGLPARISLDALPGRTFDGTVTRYAHALDEASKTMLTEIEIPNATAEILPGMYADVRLEIERKTGALLLPARAVVTERAGTFVFRDVDGKAVKTPVQIGFADGANVEIVAGLEEGQAVAVSTGRALADGMAIRAEAR